MNTIIGRTKQDEAIYLARANGKYVVSVKNALGIPYAATVQDFWKKDKALAYADKLKNQRED